jgi:hypothetical protein
MHRPDPVGAGLGVVALAGFALHGFDGELTRDLGLYAYGGQQVADGVPPYAGVMNRSGPLAHLLPGLGAISARALGLEALLGMRLLFLLLSTLCVWATYVLARDVTRGRLGGVAAAGAVVCLPLVIDYATGGPRDKTPMMLLLTWALIAMSRRQWWSTGALVALTTLTWQPAFFPALVAALGCVALTTPRGEWPRSFLAVVGGGVVVTGLMSAYFVAVGAAHDFADGFVLIHLRYTYQPGLRDDLRRQWEGLLLGFGSAIWVIVAGLLALLVLGVRTLAVARRRHDRLDRTVLAFALATVAALAWSWRVFNGWADALVLVPFAALGVGAAVAAVAEHVPWRAAAALTTVWAVMTGAAALDYSLTDGTRTLTKQQHEVDGVFAALPADATLLSVEAPQPLVLTGRTNPTRHQMFRLGLELYVDDTWPGGLDGYADTVRDEATTLVAVGRGAKYPWLLPVLDEDYVEFGTSPGWTWYVRDDVSDDVLAELSAAVRG